MHDHNLDDLIIDHIEPKKSRLKNFLTIVALIIVMMIAAIILTKVLLKDPEQHKLRLEENNTVVISPELTLQSVTQPETTVKPEPEKEKEKPELSEIIEEMPEAPVEAETVTTETTVEESEKTVEEVPEPENEPTVTPEPETEITPETALPAETPEVPAPAPITKPQPPVQTNKPIVKPKAVPKRKPTKVQLEKPKKKPVVRQIHYIQVGSFKKTPSKQFLGVITRSGFRYKITSPNVKGLKRLLIGPYNSYDAAKAALPRVKDRINKSAFIIKQ